MRKLEPSGRRISRRRRTSHRRVLPRAGRASTDYRLTAIALADNATRNKLKRDLQASRFREHKIDFNSYLAGPQGVRLLNGMVEASGLTEELVLAYLDQVRPLEVYLPIDEDRGSWQGGNDLLVAGLLEDHEVPVGFTLSGEELEDLPVRWTPPAPVLSIVPQETDFENPLTLAQWENTETNGGATVGIWRRHDGIARNCDPDKPVFQECSDGTGTIDWSSKPAGLYVTDIRIHDDYEESLKGDPEFEMHLLRPDADLTEGEFIRCAGEHAPDPESQYDQNSNLWAGAVLVASEQENDQLIADFGSDSTGFQLVFWEDDDTSCEVKTDDNPWEETVAVVEDLKAGHDAFVDDAGILDILKALWEIAKSVSNLLAGNDEFIGPVVEESCFISSTASGNFQVVRSDGNGGLLDAGCARIRRN